jgi:hypothetical protein
LRFRPVSMPSEVRLSLSRCALVTSAASAQSLTCGQVIVEDTTLQNDLSDCSGDGIVIGADGITLDLNGHTVAGCRATRTAPQTTASTTWQAMTGCGS